MGLLLLLLVQGYYVHFWPTFHPANEAVRIYFVEAVVLDGSLSIDGARERWHPPNFKDASRRSGRFYLDKAPGLSFAAVPLYAAAHALGLDEALAWTTLWHLLTLLLVTIPSLVSTALLYRLARDLAGRADVALGLAAAWAVATPALLYSTLLFGHALAAALLLGAFAALRPTSLAPVSARRAALAGFLASFAVVTEYQAILAAAGIAVFGVVRVRSPRRIAWLVAVGLVPAAALLLYHWRAFGGPLSFPYAFKADPGFAKLHATGLFGFSFPTPARAAAVLLGPRRGLLYAAPFLALWPLGLARLFGAPSWRESRWLVLWVGAAHTTFMLGYLYWTGGDCVGARFLVPALPFLVLPLAALWRPGRFERLVTPLRSAVFPGLVAVGLVHHLAAFITFPYHPESISHPFAQFSLPLLLDGCVAQNVLGLGPLMGGLVFLSLLAASGAWLFWATRRPGGPSHRWRAALVATLTALAILGAQLATAPPPDDHVARAERLDKADLMGCHGGRGR